MNKKSMFLFLGALALFLVAIFSLGDSFLTPYVSIAEAKEKAGEYVQVIGMIVKTDEPEKKRDGIVFSLIDNSRQQMKIYYKGVLPKNYSHAEKIVALGIYDKKQELFEADKILVKCPSKYKRKKK